MGKIIGIDLGTTNSCVAVNFFAFFVIFFCERLIFGYDPEGIDVELLREVKEVKRARLTEYAPSYRS